MADGFRLLVLADTHYVPRDVEADWPPRRRCRLGCELIGRAVEDADRCGGFDAVALMGDLLNDGFADWADEALETLAQALCEAVAPMPVLIVPGNHDGPAERLRAAFGHPPDLAALGGYWFIAFTDPYAEGDYCTRTAADRRRLRELADRDDAPIIALQHNPVWPDPDTDSDYPFLHTNRDEVMRDYADAGVLLSISGHYHAGGELAAAGGVRYVTAPALCESPFAYLLVTLTGREVNVDRRELLLAPDPPLTDTHVHTDFAYCREDVTAAGAIDRAQTFGLAGLCLVEHAGQLYCSEDEFWSAAHIRRPGVWRTSPHSRMPQFRRDILPLRSDSVRVGLEVALDADGELTLRDEDRDWPDLLVGAIHWLPRDETALFDAEVASLVMATCEGLLTAGVDVLAHPWRIFRWCGRAVPADLFAPLADMLAATNTAAEINFHGNTPCEDFVAACIDRNVKIALASDAHTLRDVALLGAHLALLRRAAADKALADLLF